MHDVQILCYPNRKWRSPEDRRDYWIKIVCINCRTAKEQGKQYTKRLLPDFLRPYCRIRLDLSLEYYTAHYTQSGRYDWEDACQCLGCIDLRTAKRHVTDLQAHVPEMALKLTQLLSHKSGFVRDVLMSPDTPPASLLALRVKQVGEYHTLLYGNQPPITPGFYTTLTIVHGWLSGRNLSTSYVLKSSPGHDTS